jgi:hypothetical protein
MNAKEKQVEFVKSYLKPKLREEGFSTSRLTWWKNKGDFFIVINLQNSTYNSKNELSFCFNIGVAITELIKDPFKKEATYYDTVTNLRENAYLSENRTKHKYRQNGWLGYLITDETDLIEFTEELRKDFEIDILPKLDQLNTLEDCIKFYQKFNFWGDNLKKVLEKLEK